MFIKDPNPNLPRVTEILRATESEEARDRLRKWQHKMDKIHGPGGADLASQEAREKGTHFHTYIEQFIDSGIEPQMPTEEQGRWNAGREIIQAFKPHIYACELGIQSTVLGYRGTLDALAFPNCPQVIDWKTSKRVKRESWIEDYKLQVTAYAIAAKEMGIRIQGAQIIIFSPKRCQRFIVDIEHYTPQWLERLERYKATIAA